MPVFSYLAYPTPEARDQLLTDLASLDCCEAVPAENEDLVILVTDTPGGEREKELQRKLHELSSLESLVMTFGHPDE